MKDSYKKWGWGMLAVGVALLDALFLEQYFFNVKTFDIGKKGSGKTLKLVLLTDLHFKKSLYAYQRKLASTVNSLYPDLLFIAGDTLDTYGSLPPVEKFLSLLDPQIRKVAVPGNHDRLAAPGLTGLQQVYEKHACDLLQNESRAYTIQGTRVLVTGLDDFIQGESDLAAAVQGIGFEEHHLLLLHSPLQQEKAMAVINSLNQKRAPANKLNIRYIFAGHNHGGQVRLPGYVPVLPDHSGDYVQGWYNYSAPFLYLSRGFGTSTVPFRFLSRSEVTVFHYHV